MRIDITRSSMEHLSTLADAEKIAWLKKCSPGDLLLIDAAFEAWAQPGQLQPGGAGWRVWLMMAGRGFGKTRAGAEWIHTLATQRHKRIALVGATIDEARSIMVEGASGLLSIARRRRTRVKWEPSKGLLTYGPTGSQAQLFSGDSPDGLRGPEHDYAWCDELAKWRRAEDSWSNLELGLRRGPNPRALVTTTPKPGSLLTRLRQQALTVTTGGRTADNINLPQSFVDAMVDHFGGTRLGRQELDGELFAEAEGSLFPLDLIEAARGTAPAEFDRIVVGVDPSTSADGGGDACGIVVAGRRDGVVWVLDDRSVSGMSPNGWARKVAAAAEAWGASHVVAEANQGGAMVTSVLKAADAGLKVKLVHASRGKMARAEPVAVRFERGRAKLGGRFAALEAEMNGLAAAGYEGPGRSPDRADAMVWAVTELSETRSGVPRVRML